MSISTPPGRIVFDVVVGLGCQVVKAVGDLNLCTHSSTNPRRPTNSLLHYYYLLFSFFRIAFIVGAVATVVAAAAVIKPILLGVFMFKTHTHHQPTSTS